MTWPVDDISTTSVDSQADKPDRRAFKRVFDRVKDMIGARGAAGGVASLDAGGKVPAAQIGRGSANGVAPLGADGRLPEARLPLAAIAVPIGAILPWAGRPGFNLNPPGALVNWQKCYGAWLRKADFPELFGTIQDYYLGGKAPRATEFRLPSLSGRVPRGFGGALALGARGGAASVDVTLADANMPAHRHLTTGGSYHGATASLTGQRAIAVSSSDGSHNESYVLRGLTAGEPDKGRTSEEGSGAAFSVPTLPPFLAIDWIIRAK